MTENSTAGVCLVVGAGDALGGAIARRFAAGGYRVCVARRDKSRLDPLVAQLAAAGRTALAFALDARRPEQVTEIFEKIEKEVGPLDVVVFNVGGNVRASILEMTEQKYFKTWEQCAFSGFLVGREAARRMIPRKKGTILFTGATASLRGGSQFAAFAGGKHALRALAQSMARELGPNGIHVAHVVIDGVIRDSAAPAEMVEAISKNGEDALLVPDDIAENFSHLHRQPRNSWTHEMDLRPWVERW
ncbi:MAG: SDR family NAD(P)-dependent oxidoreductase [Proteobacteria bacterium]|nr:SDR family NAD(P)-dependent oxidoreductase [Pseudomonadota bacterium]